MTSTYAWTLAGIAAFGAAFAWLETRYPYNAGQGLFRAGFWNDLVLYCFVQSYVLGLVIARIVGAIDAHAGGSRLHLVSSWSTIAQLAFFVVTHDLYIYCFHRWQHRSPLLWRLHEAHHSPRTVDWLSGVRSHSLEILINQTIEFAPLVLLGASPRVIAIKGAVSAVWGMFIHANIDVHLGALQYVINGPEMHRWHHADDPRVYQRNFSTKLAIWDWLFGTAFFPDRGREKAGNYGLHDRTYPEQFPAGYFLQHAEAFVPRTVHDAPLVPSPAGGAAPAES
jgi:sterol desaturase/sphingolipid hydroxylase (fatty acid hydroxylase superfamily)